MLRIVDVIYTCMLILIRHSGWIIYFVVSHHPKRYFKRLIPKSYCREILKLKCASKADEGCTRGHWGGHQVGFRGRWHGTMVMVMVRGHEVSQTYWGAKWVVVSCCFKDFVCPTFYYTWGNEWKWSSLTIILFLKWVGQKNSSGDRSWCKCMVILRDFP